jgi:DNA-binding SARP family transcriptional activator
VERELQATAQERTTVRLSLLAAPRLILADGTEHALPRKDAALLALLALDGPTLRQRAATLIWPYVDDEGARNNLRQRLYRLRRLAGGDVVIQGQVLTLAGGVAHDLAGLDAALTANPESCGGELLGAHDYGDTVDLAAWVDHARAQWRAARRDALAEIAAGLEVKNQIAAALLYAERAARDEPLLEHAQRRLMRLHYRRGDRGAALEVYERLKAALDVQLGETPSRETQELNALVEAAIELPLAPAPRTVAILRPTKLVGRAREYGLLEDAWNQRRVVLLHGEPGIGKSRLLADFARDHRGALVVASHAGDASLPYAGIARLLRAVLSDAGSQLKPEPWVQQELARLLPELGTPPAGPMQPLRMQRALELAIGSAGVEAIAFDDVQFADDASLELLLGLAQAGQATRWQFAIRSAEMPLRVQQWLSRHDGQSALALDLAALDVSGVRELIDGLGIGGFDAAHWAPRLHRHTGGNPLFVLETMLAMLREPRTADERAADALPVPQNLGSLIEQRLALLSPAALKLARVAAVAGDEFSLELAAEAMQTTVLDLADSWRELTQAQVLSEQGFTHDVIREGVLRGLPSPIARWLHAAVASFVEAHVAGPAQAAAHPRAAAHARAAAHWHAAGDLKRAAAAYLLAGQFASEAGRVAEQIELLQRSANLSELQGDRPAAFDALRWLVVGLLSGHPAKATRGLFERLDHLADSAFERGECARMQAIARMTLWDFDGIVEATDRALANFAASDHEDSVVCASAARATRATALARMGKHAVALTEANDLMAEADTTTSTELKLSLRLDTMNVWLVCGRCIEALPVLAETAALARREKQAQYENSAYRIAALAAMLAGRALEAHRDASRAVAMHEAMGAARGVVVQSEGLLGACCRDVGQLTQALHWLERAVAALRENEGSPLVVDAEHQLALTWLVLGRDDRVEQALSPLAGSLPTFLRVSRRLHRVWFDALRQRPVRAELDALMVERGVQGLRGHEALMIDWLALRHASGESVGADCHALALRAAAAQLPSLEVLALAEAARRGTDEGPMLDVLDRLQDIQPLMVERCTVAWWLLKPLNKRGSPAAVPRLLAWATRLREQAQPLPDLLRESFLQRNPVHRDLIAAAERARTG